MKNELEYQSKANDIQKISLFTKSDLMYDMFCWKPWLKDPNGQSKANRISLLNAYFEKITSKLTSIDFYDMLIELESKIIVLESNCDDLKALTENPKVELASKSKELYTSKVNFYIKNDPKSK